MNSCKIAVIGATGAVGRVFLDIAEQRKFPIGELRLCASERSVGKLLEFDGQHVEVELCTPELLSDVDIAFISASGNVSKIIAPMAVANKAVAIDDSSAFRMSEKVPLVVPEVNAKDLYEHSGIISIPNCSTTPLVMVLKPLLAHASVNRVIVDTYQSVTGTGSAALEEMTTQSRNILDNQPFESNVYPHQVAFNLLPHIEPFQENGYTQEEMKMVYETRKILHRPSLMVSATCVRVPVAISHSEALHIQFDREVQPDEVRDILAQQTGIQVVDDPQNDVYPMPTLATGKDEVLVGRIRKDISHSTGIVMWIVSDNLRKGAALNAIQIAEELINNDLVLSSNWSERT